MSDADAIIVDSNGFTDKKIKIESLKGLNGVTISGQVLADYLDDLSAKQIVDEIQEETKQDIGICRKPYLKYRVHKEDDGYGKVLKRSEINRLYYGSIMENLNKIKAPAVRYVLACLLTGQSLNYKQMIELIKEKSGKEFTELTCQQQISRINKSKISFLINKVGSIPAVWKLDERATEIEEKYLYSMFLNTGVSLEQACLKYPFLVSILKDRNDVDIELPWSKGEKIDVIKSVDNAGGIIGTHDESPDEQVPEETYPTLIEAISSARGKFDLNININFRIHLK